MSAETAMFPIQDVSDIEVVFGGRIEKLLPPCAEIPEQFRRHNNTTWNQLASDWFFRGVRDLHLTPKPGVDETKALRHIRAVMVSFEPKHEHKEAGCAFLLSEWFSEATWTPAK